MAHHSEELGLSADYQAAAVGLSQEQRAACSCARARRPGGRRAGADDGAHRGAGAARGSSPSARQHCLRLTAAEPGIGPRRGPAAAALSRGAARRRGEGGLGQPLAGAEAPSPILTPHSASPPPPPPPAAAAAAAGVHGGVRAPRW